MVDIAKSQKKQFSAIKKDDVNKYIETLKKDPFIELSIITAEINESKQNMTFLWRKKGLPLPVEGEINLIFENKIYLDGNGYEKEVARLLLGYMTGLNDINAIDSKLTRLKREMYLSPILFGAGMFIIIWVVFFSVRYIAMGFKKEKFD